MQPKKNPAEEEDLTEQASCRDELQEYRRGERGKQQSQKISSVSFALPRPASPVLIVGPPATILITDSSPKVW